MTSDALFEVSEHLNSLIFRVFLLFASNLPVVLNYGKFGPMHAERLVFR